MLEIQAEEGEGSGHPSEPQPPPSTAQPTNEEPIPNVGISAGGSPRCQEAMGVPLLRLGGKYTKYLDVEERGKGEGGFGSLGLLWNFGGKFSWKGG
ncbi:hypothetical protein Tco_1337375 [Tanacetum coccineum]